MNEEEKKEIVKKVLQELKSKKMMSSTSSYKSTERILFSLNALPEAINLMESEIKNLRNEYKKEIEDNVSLKSKNLIINDQEKSYYYGNETVAIRISELRQKIVKLSSQIRLVKDALNKISKNKWYDIIPKYYFQNMTIEEIAEELECSVSTINYQKKKLINKLKVYIFPDIWMDEL